MFQTLVFTDLNWQVYNMSMKPNFSLCVLISETESWLQNSTEKPIKRSPGPVVLPDVTGLNSIQVINIFLPFRIDKFFRNTEATLIWQERNSWIFIVWNNSFTFYNITYLSNTNDLICFPKVMRWSPQVWKGW